MITFGGGSPGPSPSGAGPEGATGPAESAGPADPTALGLLVEVVDYLAQARAAAADIARLEMMAFRRRVLRAVWSFAAVATGLAASVVLLAAGAAGGLAAASGSTWVGCLLAGASGIAIFVGAPAASRWWKARRSLRRAEAEHEERRRRRLRRHGRDAAMAAAADGN